MLDEAITPATSSTVKNLACSTVGLQGRGRCARRR